MLDTGLRFLTTFGLALFCGGGTSNLVDRIAFGRVVDFLKIDWGPLQSYLFNVADAAIGAGVALTFLGAVCAFARLVSRGVKSR